MSPKQQRTLNMDSAHAARAKRSLAEQLTAVIEETAWIVDDRPPTVAVYERSSESGRPTHVRLCKSVCGAAFSHDSAEQDVDAAPKSGRRIGLPLTSGDGRRIGFAMVAGTNGSLPPAQYAALSALSSSISLIIDNFRLREEREVANERQRLLDHIAEYLHQTLDLNDLIDRIFYEVNQTIDAEAQSLWLLDEHAGMICCRFATGPGAEQVKSVVVPCGEGIVGSTVANAESLLIADAQQDARHSRRAQEATGMITHSLMSVPVVRNGRAIGAIQAINKQTGTGRFDSDDLSMLRSIADVAALCIENARLYADLEASYDTTLEALAAGLDARDHETEGHSRRVVAYSARFGEALGLPQAEIRSLRRGALIHDIGKIAVPDAILRKPGALTAEEWKIMSRHPEIGFAMLRGISHLRDELDVVRAHHERWDGNGYPLGLEGVEIPLHARLFTIVDTYDALTSNRPYRASRSHSEATRILISNSGTQFDPFLVAAFLSIPPADWQRIREELAATHTPLPDTMRTADVGETRPYPRRSLPASQAGYLDTAGQTISKASPATTPDRRCAPCRQ